MAVAVTCPTCQTTLKAPDGLAGKKVKCKKCGGKLRIPDPETDAGEETIAPAEETATPEAPADANPFDFSSPAAAPAEPVPAPKKAERGKPDPKPAAKTPPPAEPPPAEPPRAAKAPPAAPPADAAVPEAVAVDEPPADELPPDELPADEPPAEGPAQGTAETFAFTGAGAISRAVTKASSAPAATPSPKPAAAPPAGRKPPPPEPEPLRVAKPGGRQSRLMPVLVGLFVLGVFAVGIGFGLRMRDATPPPAPVAQARPTEPAAPKDGDAPAVVEAAAGDPAPDDKAKGELQANPKAKDAARGRPSAPPKAAEKAAPKSAPPPDVAPDAPLTLKPGNAFTLQPLPAKAAVVQKAVVRVAAEVPVAAARRLFPPGGADGFAAVLSVSSAGVGGFGEKLALDRFNLKTGARVDRTEFAGDNRPGPRVCDLTADTFVIASFGKLTVHDFAAKKKALDAWDPYAGLPDHAKAGLAAVYLAPGKGKLVTVSTAGAVHFWDLAKKSPLGNFVPPKPAAEKLAADRGVALSDNRNTLAVAVNGTVYLIDLASGGKKRDKLELGGAVIRSLGLAVTATADKVRAVYAFEAAAPGPQGKEQAVALLESGKPEVGFYRWPADLPDATAAGWAGDHAPAAAADGAALLFRHGGDLLGSGKFAPVARVAAAGGKGLFGFTADHKLWYLIADPADAKKSVLAAVELPLEAGVDERLGELFEKQKTVGTLTAEPGGLGR